jgi:S1-C subfamily serine protease
MLLSGPTANFPCVTRQRLVAVALLGVAACVIACAPPVRLASPSEAKQATQGNAATPGTTAPAAPSPAPSVAPPAGSGALSQFQDTLRQVAAQALPSVVEINVGNGLGSGIVLDTAGNIVTNAHVVAGTSAITVTTFDRHVYNASVVGSYPANDLAVIKVALADGLRPATFGDSSKAQVGDVVLAIGAPLGLAGSVTEGIVSGLGRSATEDNGVTLNGLIQTSAAFNPGNSGGALIGLDSKVIGVPTLSAGGGAGGQAPSENVGFAIPSNQVVAIATQLVASGSVTHSNRAYLGVSVTPASGGGVVVQSVVSGGPAASAGIQPGQVIQAIDSHLISDPSTLDQILSGYKPGDRVSVTVQLPNGGTRKVPVALGERPNTP